jgi:heat shock protein HslJ
MRTEILFIAILLTTAGGFFACNKEWKKYNDCKEWEQTTIEPQALLNTTWECVGYVNVKSSMIRKCGNSIVFGEDEKLGGSTCNALDGNYKIVFFTGAINISIYAWTKMLCSAEFKEKQYLETLNKVQFFSLQENELRLYYNNKKNYLLFKRL